ncbi:probable beta-1,3-galactosyltransferase 14 [Tanacetum coccineum]
MPIPKKFFQAHLFKTSVDNNTKCKYSKPLSVSVVWDKTSTSASSNGLDDKARHKVMGFVGIQTGFASVGRRKALRQTWFPNDHQGLQRYNIFTV